MTDAADEFIFIGQWSVGLEDFTGYRVIKWGSTSWSKPTESILTCGYLKGSPKVVGWTPNTW